jgi:prepilin-type N-terminal cleavage/methylation domain-containing protein
VEKRPIRGARAPAGEGGFSLLELLITLAILPIVLAAAYLVFITLSGNYSSVSAQSEATSEAQRALDIMVREMRQAREIVIDDNGNTAALATATPTYCSFYADMDRDGVPERITYYVDGTDLYRKMEEPAASVYPYGFVNGPAQRVVNLTTTSQVVFTYYYDGSPDTPAASPVTPAQVSAIGIRLSASRPSQNGQIAVDFTTRVKIRALFNSLS